MLTTVSDQFFRTTLTVVGTSAVVTVEGDLDAANGPRVRDALEELAELGVRAVTVDLAGCTFVDGAGMAALLAGQRRLAAAAAETRVRVADRHVRHLLDRLARYSDLVIE